MDSRLTILEELKGISPVLAGLPAITPFVVPEGYFEAFAGHIMQRIKAQEVDPMTELASLSPLLSGMSKQVPYNVPENYFKELSDQALIGAKAIEFVNEELENLSPVLTSLKAVNVYDMPDGYFDALPQIILNKAKHHSSATVITMRPFRKIARYAVAAIFVGLMAIGGWFIQKPGEPPMTVAKIESGIQKASDEEMLNFIQNDEGSIADPILNADEEMDSTDMKAMLADVSDKELEQFINESNDQNNTLSN
jgi:hypothetical protein